MPKPINWITNSSSPPIFPSGATQSWSSSNRKNLSSHNFDIIGGGQDNYIAPGVRHGSILGGNRNHLLGSCSFIGGGTNNISSGACSAILGGQGNNDGGFNDTFIVGSGINVGAVGIPNALHVNGLWANGLPTYAGGPPIAPAGTVFILAPGTPAPAWAQGQLWIA
jgi:hypothetical protein